MANAHYSGRAHATCFPTKVATVVHVVHEEPHTHASTQEDARSFLRCSETSVSQRVAAKSSTE